MRRKKSTKFALDLYFTPTVKKALIQRLIENPDRTSRVIEVFDNEGYHVWIDGVGFIKAGVLVGNESELIYMERIDK